MKVGDKVVVRREDYKRGALNKITGPERGMYQIHYAGYPQTNCVTKRVLDLIFGKPYER